MPQAASLAERILKIFGNKIKTLTLVPSSGGVFEVTLEDELVHSKKRVGKFPAENSIVEAIRERL